MNIEDSVKFNLKEIVNKEVFTFEYKQNFLANQLIHCLGTLNFKDVHLRRKEQEVDIYLEAHEYDYPVNELEKVDIEYWSKHLLHSPIARNNKIYGDVYEWTWQEHELSEYHSAKDLCSWEDDFKQIASDPIGYIEKMWALEIYRNIPKEEREIIDVSLLKDKNQIIGESGQSL